MIIPALLENNIKTFSDRIASLSAVADLKRVQVDFVDGIFVQGHSLGLFQLPDLNPEYEWEAHLMIQSPKNFFDYREKGFTKIIIHYEAYSSMTELLEAIQAVKDMQCVPAVAVNPDTSIISLRGLSGNVQNFTVMSVRPGRQGGVFISSVYDRVKQLRSLLPEANIEVDGGINVNNIVLLADAGANDFAVGSSIFAAGSPADNYAKLQRAIAW